MDKLKGRGKNTFRIIFTMFLISSVLSISISAFAVTYDNMRKTSFSSNDDLVKANVSFDSSAVKNENQENNSLKLENLEKWRVFLPIELRVGGEIGTFIYAYMFSFI